MFNCWTVSRGPSSVDFLSFESLRVIGDRVLSVLKLSKVVVVTARLSTPECNNKFMATDFLTCCGHFYDPDEREAFFINSHWLLYHNDFVQQHCAFIICRRR